MHHPGEIIGASQNTGLSMSPLTWLLILIAIGLGITVIYYLLKSKKEIKV